MNCVRKHYSIFITLSITILIITTTPSLLWAGTVDWAVGSPANWHAAAVTVTVSSSTDARTRGGSSLRVHGAAEGLADFAASDTHPMKPMEFYRLSAWVKVAKHSGRGRPPLLKCVFEAEPGGSFLGQAVVEGYDPSKAGAWQRLTREFRVPYGTVRGRLAVGQADRIVDEDRAVDFDVLIDGIAVESIPHYTIEGKYTFDPVPASLERMRGVHPRMYFTAADIPDLKRRIATTHKALFDEFIAQTDGILKRDPPNYMDEDGWSNIEQLYMRGVGNNMPYLALAWVLTGERKYLEGAKKWALAACGYPTWGLHEFANVDLSTGHQLFGLSMVYDWCWHDLDPETRRTIRETMAEKASHLFDVAAKGVIVKDPEAYAKHPWPEWDEAWLQNHLWINSCGLGVAGIALFDEVDGAIRWPAFTLDRYRRTWSVLGGDGASHEGPGYWSYGVDWMLKFMYLSRQLLDADLYGHPWFRETWKYRVYMGLPRNSWEYSNTTVDVGDSRRYDWYGPDYMLRALAAEFREGHAQWLADELDAADVEHPIDRWLNILWYDPAVKPIPQNDLPTMYRFPDIDIASMRSDWSGDESFVFFKCGPYLGHTAIRTMTYCPSSAHHVHPDTNNFMVFACGEWQIIDDGYRAKWTEYHNSLLVDGRGQLGGAHPIFNGVEPHAVEARPRIVRAVSTPELDHLTGDGTEAYAKETGLERFHRHLLFMKPDVLIVLDDIALKRPKELELRFHPERQESETRAAMFFLRGEKSVLRLEPLTREGVSVRDEKLDTLPKEEDGKVIPMYTIRLNTRRSRWRNAVALSWSAKDAVPVRVRLTEDGDTWTFNARGRAVVFDWRTGDATFERR